ncbi:MAG: nucleotide exchange factor GrpE [Oscillospiraceae bacterium]|jgi:molecular chaperone GrpE|nr:nucleotide exchange factor GrpE [Oscillospiraceae bacterium]
MAKNTTESEEVLTGQTEAAEAPAAEETPVSPLEEELQSLNEKFLRLAAEYDNYRKRTAREISDCYPRAKADCVAAVLPAMDDFYLALQHGVEHPVDFIAQAQKVYNQLNDALIKLGAEAFGAPGDAFDPNLHQSVSHIDDPSLGKNVLATVYKQGCRIGSRIVREAVVVTAN